MANLLLLSPYATEPNLHISMDLAEARRRRFMYPRTSSWLLASNRFLSSCICSPSPLRNVYRFTLSAASQCTILRSTVLTAKRGQSADTLRGYCEVVWIIKADLAAGQHLYVTGDPSVLGSWDPDMAVLMSPMQNENLWKAEVKVASGMNFRYNYFVKAGTGSCDIVWRAGPEFSLSLPLFSKQDKVVVRDLWTRSPTRRHQSHLWGSWIEETFLPMQSLDSAPVIDENKIIEIGLKESKPFLDDFIVEDATVAEDEESRCDTVFSKRNQPVEEPWLLQSSITMLVSADKLADMPKDNENIEENQPDLDTDDQDQQMEKLLPKEGIFSKEESASTIILINSSTCTMQRIAVLEDEKLVELLLEPVKSNVLCDSVYLGVVSKLVPHMGGAFVNIGSARHSLMDIRHSREPFVFPPFRESLKKQETNGSVVHVHEDDPTPYEDNEDINDDDDVTEVLEENINGNVVDYGEGEIDFEDCVDLEEHHDETINDCDSAALETSIDSHTSNILNIKNPKRKKNNVNRWSEVRKGTKIIVQVVKEGLGTKSPTLTAYPKLRSRFWILLTRCDRIGVSKKVSGVERTRLRVIAKKLQPKGFGLTVRTVAAGRSLEELQKDLDGLLSTWKHVVEDAKSAALAADEGVEGTVPVLLHRAMGQTLSVVQDYFSDKVTKMVVESPRIYHEVTNYLQDIAPDLCDRVELFDKRIPLFDLYNIEEEINSILSKRVPLPNGGSLVIEQTEALVSIDVNGGHGMFGHKTSQEKAILEVNLAAARQIARELRLRDIGGIIVVDFIDMADELNKRLVYEEVKKAVERDRSMVKVSELSRHGLMEITRKRVRPSVTFMISEPCACCHATGRVEALETSFSKIEQEICRLLAKMKRRADPGNPKSWPRFVLRVDNHMSAYLTTGKKTRLATLSSSLKVWIVLKVARGFVRGTFEVKAFSEEKKNQRMPQVAISLLRGIDTSPPLSGKTKTLVSIKKGKANRK